MHCKLIYCDKQFGLFQRLFIKTQQLNYLFEWIDKYHLLKTKQQVRRRVDQNLRRTRRQPGAVFDPNQDGRHERPPQAHRAQLGHPREVAGNRKGAVGRPVEDQRRDHEDHHAEGGQGSVCSDQK